MADGRRSTADSNRRSNYDNTSYARERDHGASRRGRDRGRNDRVPARAGANSYGQPSWGGIRGGSELHPRNNVIGHMSGSPARPLLHFNGHFDVVPVGDGWTVEPFGALVRDGKMYG